MSYHHCSRGQRDWTQPCDLSLTGSALAAARAMGAPEPESVLFHISDVIPIPMEAPQTSIFFTKFELFPKQET